jgi:hypothetical protein
MYQYIMGVVGRTLWQLFQLFAVPFVLAVALQWVGNMIRRRGVSRFGDAYWYFVAPGVACHETGHAVGCLLTGCKIYEFVPFTRTDDEMLGYVSHEAKSGLWGGVSSFLISSGPVWFGCLLVVLLTRFFGDSGSVARYSDFFSNDVGPGLLEYVCGLWSAALGFLSSLFVDGTWGWGFGIWLYLVFCIASEIGLSNVDLQHMWRGVGIIAGALLLVNLMPPVGRCLSVGIFIVLPWLFKFHVLMLFALILNLSLFIVMRMIMKLWPR